MQNSHHSIDSKRRTIIGGIIVLVIVLSTALYSIVHSHKSVSKSDSNVQYVMSHTNFKSKKFKSLFKYDGTVDVQVSTAQNVYPFIYKDGKIYSGQDMSSDTQSLNNMQRATTITVTSDNSSSKTLKADNIVIKYPTLKSDDMSKYITLRVDSIKRTTDKKLLVVEFTYYQTDEQKQAYESYLAEQKSKASEKEESQKKLDKAIKE